MGKHSYNASKETNVISSYTLANDLISLKIAVTVNNSVNHIVLFASPPVE